MARRCSGSRCASTSRARSTSSRASGGCASSSATTACTRSTMLRAVARAAPRGARAAGGTGRSARATAARAQRRLRGAVLELGTLPPVSCYLAELNQVFLNLLINAAHAIRDVVGDSGRRGRITVRSWRDGPDVIIAIADTGTGIPVEAREHVFEHFFTTREVGRRSPGRAWPSRGRWWSSGTAARSPSRRRSGRVPPSSCACRWAGRGVNAAEEKRCPRSGGC